MLKIIKILLCCRLSQTCNHVAALLFRVEAAVRAGLTNPTCTSKKAEWNVPCQKADVPVTPIDDLDIQVFKYGEVKKRPLVDQRKKAFVPLQGDTESPEEKRNHLLSKLEKHLPNAVSVLHWQAEKKGTSRSEREEEIPSMLDLKNHILESGCVEGDLGPDDITKIEQLTAKQSQSPLWHKARFGRITASNCHDVMTKMVSLGSEPESEESADNLVKRLLYPTSFESKAMALGKEWEDKAFNRYKYHTNRENSHQNFEASKCGIFVSRSGILGASPDGLVSCKCHGPGVVEIKCAVKYWGTDPKSEEVVKGLPYLAARDKMNEKHKYFSQVQFQMGITSRNFCHFVVFTLACVRDDTPPLVLHVPFNKSVFTNLKEKAEFFWHKYIFPELQSEHLLLEGKPQDEASCRNKGYDHLFAKAPCSLCPACHSVCKEDRKVTTFSERSIACDHCNTWFHFSCVKMTKKKLDSVAKSSWYCHVCRKM